MDIDLLDDQSMQQRMAWEGILILVSGVLVGVLLGIFLPHENLSLWWFVALVGLSVVALPMHELVHAAAFVLLSGFHAHIRFGFSSWMLYTVSPGTTLPRKWFCVVLLAPAVIVTCALLGIAILKGHPLLGWFLAVIHLSGCTGDIAYVRIIMRDPSATHVLDTERGIALLHDE